MCINVFILNSLTTSFNLPAYNVLNYIKYTATRKIYIPYYPLIKKLHKASHLINSIIPPHNVIKPSNPRYSYEHKKRAREYNRCGTNNPAHINYPPAVQRVIYISSADTYTCTQRGIKSGV